MEQSQKKTLLILFALLLSSACSTPPAVIGCKEFSMEKAYCINTIKDEEFWVDEQNKFEDKTWFEQRHTMIQLPISSWVKIKAYLMKECKKYNKCEELEAMTKRVDEIAK